MSNEIKVGQVWKNKKESFTIKKVDVTNNGTYIYIGSGDSVVAYGKKTFLSMFTLVE